MNKYNTPRFILVEGFRLSLVMTLTIFATLLWNPYLWLSDYPPDIQAAVGSVGVPALQQAIAGLVFVAVGIAVLSGSHIRFARAHDGQASFYKAFFTLFLVSMVFSLFDLVVIDWLIINTLQPGFVVLPGTQGLAGYSDYAFHFRQGFLGLTPYIGAALSVLVSIAVGKWRLRRSKARTGGEIGYS